MTQDNTTITVSTIDLYVLANSFIIANYNLNVISKASIVRDIQDNGYFGSEELEDYVVSLIDDILEANS